MDWASWYEALRRKPSVVIDGVDHVIAEGDVPVPRAGLRRWVLRRMRDVEAARRSGGGLRLTGQLAADGRLERWKPGTTLVWCVDRASFGPRTDWYLRAAAAFRAAAVAWEGATQALHFVYRPDLDLTPSSAHFRVQLSTSEDPRLLALAFFPWEFPARRSIHVYPACYDDDPDAIALHELGHVCGFRHEHIRPESGLVSEEGSAGIHPLTPYDRESVMHYPTPDRPRFLSALSPSDVAGAQSAYGALAPAPVVPEPTMPVTPPPPATSSAAAAAPDSKPRFVLPTTRSVPGVRTGSKPGTIGFGRVQLTVPLGIPRAGYALGSGKGEAFKTLLYARAMVMEDLDGRVFAIVVNDLHSGSRYLHEAICHLTRAMPCAIDNHELIVAGTHTHLGPGYFYGNPMYDRLTAGDPSWTFREGLASQLATDAAAAVAQAWANRRPGSVTVRQGRVLDASRNRSIVAFDADGAPWAVPGMPGHGLTGSPQQRAIDPRLVVISAQDPAGAVFGLFATFATHNTALRKPDRVYDADWAGRVAAQLEQQLGPGSAALIALSAAGDMTPMAPDDVPGGSSIPKQGLDLVDHVTDRVVGEIKRVLAVPAAPSDFRLRAWYTDWKTPDGATIDGKPGTALAEPVLGAPTTGGAEDYRSAVAVFCPEGMTSDHFDPDHAQHPKAPAFLVQGVAKTLYGKLPASPAHGVHVLCIGRHAICTFPGEPTVRAAWAIESKVRLALPTLSSASVLGYANDYAGYLTTAREYDKQHYEGSSTIYGRHELAHFLALVDRMLRQAQPWRAPDRALEPFPDPAAASSTALQGANPVGVLATHQGIRAWWTFPLDAAPPATRATLTQEGEPALHAEVHRVDTEELALVWAVFDVAPAGAQHFALDVPGTMEVELVGKTVTPFGTSPFVPNALPATPAAAPVGATDLDPDALLAQPPPAPTPDAQLVAAVAAAAQVAPAEVVDPAVFAAWRVRLATDPVGLGRDLAWMADRKRRMTDAQAAAFAAECIARLDAAAAAPGVATAASAPLPMPPDFGFPGYDPVNIPVDPGERKFEPGADWVAWAVHSGAPWAAQNAGTLDPEDERRPQDFPSGCTYTIPEAATVALFADFGCGLAPARYIARQIVAERAPVAVHLGDVYYAGRAAEVDAYMKAPMEPLMDSTDLFLLAGNHDLYDRGRSFHRYLDSKRLQHPATQRQEAEVFRLVNSTHQILGLDTEWWRPGRMKPDHVTRLRTWAEEGRAAGKMNILLTSDHPYDFGDAKATRLWADVKPVVGAGLVDLWFWGNVHHAALYGSNERFPFTGSCIGWGGFPDERLDASKAKKTAAPVRWAEYAWRYAPWRLREDRVNNGWCRMRLVPGGVQLEYVDWMGRLRAEATVKRAGGITALTAFDP